MLNCGLRKKISWLRLLTVKPSGMSKHKFISFTLKVAKFAAYEYYMTEWP